MVISLIDQSGRVLLALLNDLLDLAKLEAGKMVFDFQKTDFSNALYSVHMGAIWTLTTTQLSMGGGSGTSTIAVWRGPGIVTFCIM